MDPFHWRFTEHAQPGEDPRVDPELAGETTYQVWPENLQKELESMAGERHV